MTLVSHRRPLRIPMIALGVLAGLFLLLRPFVLVIQGHVFGLVCPFGPSVRSYLFVFVVVL